MSVKEQATRSVIWSAVERFSVQGVQFLLSLVIARLLLPSDYGTVAMLSFFMAIGQTFIDGGFANALIQKKKKREADFSTVFYFNILISLVIYFLLFAGAPWIAVFFKTEVLVDLTRVFGLILIVNSFGIVQQARLTIALDFRRQAYASLIAVLISGGVGVWMAFHGYGVWTLVWQALLNNLLRVLCIWFFSRWMPRWEFSMQSFRELFGFGSKLLLSSLLHTIYTNLYTVIIARFFSSSQLGYYNRSFTIAQFPSVNITNVIVRAVYPIQCRVQDDLEETRNFFMKYMRMSCYVIFPVMIALCAVAEPLVKLILTDKWLPMVPMLQLLCIAFMWDPVMRINNNILNVKGRSDYFLYAEIIKKAVAFLLLLMTLPFGVVAMCAGLVVYAFADIFIIVYYSRKLIGITLAQQFRALSPVLGLTGSMGFLMYAVTLVGVFSPFVKLTLALTLGVAYFLVGSWIFRFQEFDLLRSLLLRKK